MLKISEASSRIVRRVQQVALQVLGCPAGARRARRARGTPWGASAGTPTCVLEPDASPARAWLSTNALNRRSATTNDASSAAAAARLVRQREMRYAPSARAAYGRQQRRLIPPRSMPAPATTSGPSWIDEYGDPSAQRAALLGFSPYHNWRSPSRTSPSCGKAAASTCPPRSSRRPPGRRHTRRVHQDAQGAVPRDDGGRPRRRRGQRRARQGASSRFSCGAARRRPGSTP